MKCRLRQLWCQIRTLLDTGRPEKTTNISLSGFHIYRGFLVSKLSYFRTFMSGGFMDLVKQIMTVFFFYKENILNT